MILNLLMYGKCLISLCIDFTIKFHFFPNPSSFIIPNRNEILDFVFFKLCPLVMILGLEFNSWFWKDKSEGIMLFYLFIFCPYIVLLTCIIIKNAKNSFFRVNDRELLHFNGHRITLISNFYLLSGINDEIALL